MRGACGVCARRPCRAWTRAAQIASLGETGERSRAPLVPVHLLCALACPLLSTYQEEACSQRTILLLAAAPTSLEELLS